MSEFEQRLKILASKAGAEELVNERKLAEEKLTQKAEEQKIKAAYAEFETFANNTLIPLLRQAGQVLNLKTPEILQHRRGQESSYEEKNKNKSNPLIGIALRWKSKVSLTNGNYLYSEISFSYSYDPASSQPFLETRAGGKDANRFSVRFLEPGAKEETEKAILFYLERPQECSVWESSRIDLSRD